MSDHRIEFAKIYEQYEKARNKMQKAASKGGKKIDDIPDYQKTDMQNKEETLNALEALSKKYFGKKVPDFAK